MEENSVMASTTSHGRSIVPTDYRKLAGYDSVQDGGDGKSVKSCKSNKSNKSKASKRSKKVGQEDPRKSSQHQDTELDLTVGDFDNEDEILSVGSDASRLEAIQKQIEMNLPTTGEMYNERKVEEGEQDRLEDVDLPNNLEQQDVYDEWKELHKKQLAATEDREVRSQWVLELIGIREEILEKREQIKQLE